MLSQLLMFAFVAAASLYPSPVGITKADVEPAAPIPAPAPQEETLDTRTMYVTAYSSTPEETDDTPFTTAMGTTVRDGIVATNELPFKTKIKMPALYGDKIFVVEDRMHERMVNKVDIWMPTKADAKRFGIVKTEIVVLK